MSTNVDVPQYELHEEVALDPARSTLIVVDMQNDFVKDGGTLQVPDAQATIPCIQRLLESARGSGMRVAFSQDTGSRSRRRASGVWQSPSSSSNVALAPRGNRSALRLGASIAPP